MEELQKVTKLVTKMKPQKKYTRLSGAFLP